jgi:hypothetical protein
MKNKIYMLLNSKKNSAHFILRVQTNLHKYIYIQFIIKILCIIKHFFQYKVEMIIYIKKHQSSFGHHLILIYVPEKS